MDEVFIPAFFLWPRQAAGWTPGCTHLSLSEGVRGDLQLTEEELTMAAALRTDRQRKISRLKTARHRQRLRDVDYEAYQAKRQAENKAWSDKNPGKVNEMAAGVRQRAIEAKCFHCEVCDHSAATQFNLDAHLQSEAHAKAVKNGGRVEVVPTRPSLRMKASRQDAIANRRYYCSPCKKACSSAMDLKRHQSRDKHKATVRAAALA